MQRRGGHTVLENGAALPHVPARALLISAGALAIPIAAVLLGAEVLEEYEILFWLPALVPAFLLTYYRGWGGASLGLAAAMAVLTLVQVGLLLFDTAPPDWKLVLIVVLLLLGVCMGLGWFGELLHRARRRAEADALRDPLTGLPNRGHLQLFLGTAFGAAERGGHLVVVIFDLDHFKRVNDRHGHAAGDRTLMTFGQILRTYTRRSDLTARFGGEEFVSVLTGAGGVPGALIFAERVRDALRTADLPWGPVTVSVGVAGYAAGAMSPDLVLAEADRALYEAKEAGRDRVQVAGPVRGEAAGSAAEVAEPRAAATPPADPPSRVPGRRRRRRGARVLVVSDDEIVGEGISRILRRAGFRTVVARDGVEALERAERRRPPDLVLSEVVMPRMGGLTLADRLSERCPATRVLLMSGYEPDSLAGSAPRPGVSFLRKPVTPAALVEAVRTAVGREMAAD